MTITVKLFAAFRIGRFPQEQREYSEGTICCLQVVADIGIEGNKLGAVLVNGRRASLDQTLVDGDSVSLLPLLGRG